MPSIRIPVIHSGDDTFSFSPTVMSAMKPRSSMVLRVCVKNWRGVLFLPLFFGILLSNGEGRQAREDVSLADSDVAVAEFDVEMAVEDVEADPEDAEAAARLVKATAESEAARMSLLREEIRALERQMEGIEARAAEPYQVLMEQLRASLEAKGAQASADDQHEKRKRHKRKKRRRPC